MQFIPKPGAILKWTINKYHNQHYGEPIIIRIIILVLASLLGAPIAVPLSSVMLMIGKVAPTAPITVAHITMLPLDSGTLYEDCSQPIVMTAKITYFHEIALVQWNLTPWKWKLILMPWSSLKWYNFNWCKVSLLWAMIYTGSQFDAPIIMLLLASYIQKNACYVRTYRPHQKCWQRLSLAWYQSVGHWWWGSQGNTLLLHNCFPQV